MKLWKRLHCPLALSVGALGSHLYLVVRALSPVSDAHIFCHCTVPTFVSRRFFQFKWEPFFEKVKSRKMLLSVLKMHEMCVQGVTSEWFRVKRERTAQTYAPARHLLANGRAQAQPGLSRRYSRLCSVDADVFRPRCASDLSSFFPNSVGTDTSWSSQIRYGRRA